jgi:hypothetical protein
MSGIIPIFAADDKFIDIIKKADGFFKPSAFISAENNRNGSSLS